MGRAPGFDLHDSRPLRLTVDHWAFLTQPAHRDHVLSVLRGALHHPGVLELRVLHESDGACCERQTWEATLADLAALAQKRIP